MTASSPIGSRREPAVKSNDLVDEQSNKTMISRRKKAHLFSGGSYLFSSLRGTDMTRSGVLKSSTSEEKTQAIKMDILRRNPAIYNRFRASLVSSVYTHGGVSHCLADFFEHELRMPEMRDEIHKMCPEPEKTSRGGLLAYLTGETSPSSCKNTVRALAGVNESREGCDSMGIPSMEGTESSDDDDFLVSGSDICVEGIRLEF